MFALFFDNGVFQVSYLIVDEAEEDLELSRDPFLEAGIDIPTIDPGPLADRQDTVSIAPSMVSSTASGSKIKAAMSSFNDLHKKVLCNNSDWRTQKTGPETLKAGINLGTLQTSTSEVNIATTPKERQRNYNSCSIDIEPPSPETDTLQLPEKTFGNSAFPISHASSEGSLSTKIYPSLNSEQK